MQYFRIVETDGEEASSDSCWEHFLLLMKRYLHTSAGASAVVCLQWYCFGRWDFKGRVRWLRVNKGLKGFKTFRCFSRVPSEHERFGAPVLAGHTVLRR